MKKITLFTLIGFALFLSGCTINDAFNKNASKPRTNENVNNVIINDSVTDTMTEAEARVTAEKTCIKGGESLSAGYYNAGTKTWWFDANLNATKEGCHPACVVSEETKTAEINWRCTGLLNENNNSNEQVACTMEAKECPDGSYVGRSGPNCEFAPCP